MQLYTINLMADYRSKLLSYSPKPIQRADQWALINKQKALQEETTKIYQQKLQQQKRKKLKQQLDQQVRERNSKQLAIKNQQQYYGQISERQVREARDQLERKRIQQIYKRKQMEEQNKQLFNGIIQSKFRQGLHPASTSIDIGANSQHQRRIMVQTQRRGMIDELDRQIRQKQQQKQQIKKQDFINDQVNLSYQLNRFEVRDKLLKSRYFGQNPHTYNYYEEIKERQRQKQRQFQRIQIEQAGKRKQMEELNKINQNNLNKKYLNYKMKEILEEQIKIKDQQKIQESRINPQDISYGTIGKMLMQRRREPNKQQYFQDLKKQIEQKQKRQEAEKYMNEEQYKINLNHLNRAIQGTYANKNYVDRSIHALSDSHKVNIALIDTHLKPLPQAEIARQNIETLKARNRERLSVSLNDRSKSNNF